MSCLTNRVAWSKAAVAFSTLALLASGFAAEAAEQVKKPAAHGKVARKPAARQMRVAAADRPLLIRRRIGRPVDIVSDGAGFDDYIVPQHSWNDPRLYYFGPFRTGGEVFYGDEAGNPITRGNSELGQIAGYGPARGGFGGPHFDAVGGFHQGPGPDAKIDNDYASGSISTPVYSTVNFEYPSVRERVSSLNTGVVPRGGASKEFETPAVRGGRGDRDAATAQAEAEFSRPMKRMDPNQGLPGDKPLPTFGDLTGGF